MEEDGDNNEVDAWMDENTNIRAKKNRKFDLTFKLAVVKYAEQHSGAAAARRFNVDPKRVREWKKLKSQITFQADSGGKRARLSGGGRKKVSEELESKLVQWIHHTRGRNLRVSRRMIRLKAKELYSTASDKRDGKAFGATVGWLFRFLRRNNFSLRRKTTVAQEDAPVEKIVNFIAFCGRHIESKKIDARDIIAMDETAVWFDMVGDDTASARGGGSVPVKTAGHEKARIMVALAAKADGTKLEPFVVFKGAAGDVASMQDIPGVVITSSENGWFNDDLTKEWLQRVVGKSYGGSRLLVWDAYRCHVSAATKAELETVFGVTAAVIPAGCAKYVQAPDVVWSAPFKAHLRGSYDDWMAGDADKTYTNSGNLRAPSRRLLIDWVLKAWDALDRNTLINSFKVCGLTVAADGSEDHLIHCLKEGEAWQAGRELLQAAREQAAQAADHEPQSDEEEEFQNELVIEDEDDEGDEGEGEAEAEVEVEIKEEDIKEEIKEEEDDEWY